MRRFSIPSALVLLVAVSACSEQPQVERIELGEVETGPGLSVSLSPDSVGAIWTISPDGKGLRFGKTPDAPYLTLFCHVTDKAPPQLSLIHHAQSEPGAKALFPVIGNGIISRFPLDATLLREGWRWENRFPASSPDFDVFMGTREIQATLPGGGMLMIEPSALPREFIEWCRRNGEPLPPVPPPAADAAEVSSPSPDR